MHKTRIARVAGALAAAGVLVLPVTAAAQNGGGDPVIDEEVDQHSWAGVFIDQLSDSNSGWNTQDISSIQTNETDQSVSGSADGGAGDATAGTEGATTATGGAGGGATSSGGAASTNSSGGNNALTTGNASATNASTAGVSQTQTNSSTNDALSDVSIDLALDGDDADMASASGAGGGGGGTVIESDVSQRAATEVEVVQTATANSGNNIQTVSDDQLNSTGQDVSSSGDGGAGTATGGETGDTTATGGDGGTAAATGSATSSNSTGGGNTLTTGDASASNTSNVTVTQSSSNTSSNTTTATVVVTVTEGP